MCKSEYAACKRAQEMLMQADEMLANGMELTKEQIIEYEAVASFCDRAMNRAKWKNYHEEVEGAVYPDTHEHHLTDEQAKEWVASMYNVHAGQKMQGEHWTKDQTTAVGKQYGIDFKEVSEVEWWATLNAMWHDHYKSAVIANMLTEPKFFVELAKDFLFDDDSSKTPSERLYAYHMYM